MFGWSKPRGLANGAPPRWIEGQVGTTPGAEIYGYAALDLAPYPQFGGGNKVLGQLFPCEGAGVFRGTRAGAYVYTQGYGGLQMGQIRFGPLVDPSAT